MSSSESVAKHRLPLASRQVAATLKYDNSPYRGGAMTMIDRITIGDRLRAWRKERGISQTELGNRIGMSQRTVSRIESNRYVDSLRSDILMRLSEETGIPYDDLALAAGLVTTRNAARALFEEAKRSRSEREWLAELHAQLDPILLELHPEEFTALVRHAKLLEKISASRRQVDSPDASPRHNQAEPAPDGAGR